MLSLEKLNYELLLVWLSSGHLHLIIAVATIVVVVAATIYTYLSGRRGSVYLIDFACFKPPSSLRVPFALFKEHALLVDFLDEKSIRFMNRILERSGLGEETCLPPLSRLLPPSHSIASSLAEARLVIFSAIDDLLRKTNLNPVDIDVLIVNCSLFSPIPSLSALIVNHYRLRSNIRAFNLSGMGCSAGLISVDLARHLLNAGGKYALVVSTEIITPNYYIGKQPSMLLPNCLFRMGGAAVLISTDRRRAKYQLLNLVRTHCGAHDSAFNCVQEAEDDAGNSGVSLSKDLMIVAGDALKKPYMPDFRKAFKHFCIHAGGRAVIDELQKRLRLSPEHVEASRMVLHRFGNTSSSSLWYELKEPTQGGGGSGGCANAGGAAGSGEGPREPQASGSGEDGPRETMLSMLLDAAWSRQSARRGEAVHSCCNQSRGWEDCLFAGESNAPTISAGGGAHRLRREDGDHE